jgi:molecular chaperone DnaK
MTYGLGIGFGAVFTGAAVSWHGQARIVTIDDEAVLASPLAVPRYEQDPLVRSNVLLFPDGGTRLAEPVPLALGGRAHRGRLLLAKSLRSILDTVTELEHGAPAGVALTCPAVWGPVRRQQFGDISRQLGLETVSVVSEPEAVATCFAAAKQLVEGDLVAVYDLGAVTADLTVVRVTGSGMEILGLPEALEGVGGLDFDDVVLAHVDQVLGGALTDLDPTDPVALAVLSQARAECIRAKEALSRVDWTTVTVRFPSGISRVNLSRRDFESMIRTGVESTLAGLYRSLVSAGVGIGDLAAVVLVGGSSRIPLVAEILGAGLGRPVLINQHPQHCAALGAAAIAGDLARAAVADVPSLGQTRGYRAAARLSRRPRTR